MRASTSESARGAYGLALPDLPGAAGLLAATPDWPEWRIGHRFPHDGEMEDLHEILAEERARLRLSGGGFVEVSRPAGSSLLVLPARPRDTEIVHPFLGLTAATAARWRGWLAFHAGVLVAGGSAWGVIGPKGAGKSTFLAWFAGRNEGGAVLADDVLIVDDRGHALTGPRCIDLREGAAARFGPSEALGVVGARERWRMPLGPAPLSAPLKGWIRLEWGESNELERLPPSQAFATIAGNLALRVLPPNAEDLLRLAALPTWRLARPARFELMDELEPELARIFETSTADVTG